MTKTTKRRIIVEVDILFTHHAVPLARPTHPSPGYIPPINPLPMQLDHKPRKMTSQCRGFEARRKEGGGGGGGTGREKKQQTSTTKEG